MQRDDEIEMQASIKYNDPCDNLTEQALRTFKEGVRRERANEIQFWLLMGIGLGLLWMLPRAINNW